MDYSNPKIPEGINSARDSALKEAAFLCLVVSAGLGILFWLCLLLADWAAPHIPFSWEKKIAILAVSEAGKDVKVDGWEEDLQRVQKIGRAISTKMALPPDMTITFHLSGGPAFQHNAFATFGGHIFMGRGLLRSLPDDRSLAFVLAHEVAHVRARHVAKAAGRNLVFALISLSLFGEESTLQQFLSVGNLLATFQYSRALEEEADAVALDALIARYGEPTGYRTAFQVLGDYVKPKSLDVSWLKTRPEISARIERLDELARQKGFAISP